MVFFHRLGIVSDPGRCLLVRIVFHRPSSQIRNPVIAPWHGQAHAQSGQEGHILLKWDIPDMQVHFSVSVHSVVLHHAHHRSPGFRRIHIFEGNARCILLHLHAAPDIAAQKPVNAQLFPVVGRPPVVIRDGTPEIHFHAGLQKVFRDLLPSAKPLIIKPDLKIASCGRDHSICLRNLQRCAVWQMHNRHVISKRQFQLLPGYNKPCPRPQRVLGQSPVNIQETAFGIGSQRQVHAADLSRRRPGGKGPLFDGFPHPFNTPDCLKF